MSFVSGPPCSLIRLQISWQWVRITVKYAHLDTSLPQAFQVAHVVLVCVGDKQVVQSARPMVFRM